MYNPGNWCCIAGYSVDPGQFLSVCRRSPCNSARKLVMTSPCRLAAAFVHLCQQNHVPMDLPLHCSVFACV
ncbi:unnamed protein product [Arctogadus glacialis]